MNYQFANNESVSIDKKQPGTVTSEINISGVEGTVSDVDVVIDINHSYTGDLIVSLNGPEGTRVTLIDKRGGDSENLILTEFDDDAFKSVEDAKAPFTGSFIPEHGLAAFNDIDPNGTWTLEIEDVQIKDGGQLKSWKLQLKTADVNENSLFLENSTPRLIDSEEKSTTVSAINVTGHSDKVVKNVRVQLNIEHTYNKDLTITLISPDGQRVQLVNRRGGSKNNFQSTIFSDEAEKSITEGKAPFKGEFRPEDALSTFNDSKVTGPWTLEVIDNAWKDGGQLNSWSLTIETGDAEIDTTDSEFIITVEFLGGLSSTQQAVFQDAAERWKEIIIGKLPAETVNNRLIDGLYIGAKGEEIDSEGGVLGQARPVHLRSSSNNYLPLTGIMAFDTSDLARMEDDGSLLDVIVHEMGHVIGIGTIWRLQGLLQGKGSATPEFLGQEANKEYAKLIQLSDGEEVPVEGNSAGPGTADSHWRDSVFGPELMTGYINAGVKNPISAVTVAALKDMGYQVNMASADDFELPAPALVASLSSAPNRRQCCLMDFDIPHFISGDSASLITNEVTFMEQISWSVNVSATSGVVSGDKGVVDTGAITSIPVTLDPETKTDLNLQLAVTDELDMFSATSSLYDESVVLSVNSNDFKLTGPVMLFGDFVKRFSTDLTTLSVENKSTTDKAEVKIVIGRALGS